MVKKMIKGTLKRSRLILGLTVGVFLLSAAISSGAGGVSGLGGASGEKHVTGNGTTPPTRNALGTAKVTDRSAEANESSEATSASETVEPQPQATPGFDITSSVIAGGGGSSLGGIAPNNLALDGTIGQAVAGTTSSNGPFSVTGGFWQQQPNSTVTISGTIRYCSGATTPAVPNAGVALTGDATDNTSTDASGLYTLTENPGSYTVTPSKTPQTPDAAGIDTGDVVATRREASGIPTLTGCRLLAADTNGDSFVDTADVLPIRRFAAGLTTSLANVGQWRFNPTNRTYISIISDQLNQDYDALVIGDTNGDLTPSSPTTSPKASAPTSESVSPLTPEVVATVSLPSASVSTPTVTTFTLPVTTSNIPASDNLVGFQGDFTFDPTVVDFQAIAASTAGLTAGAGMWSVIGTPCPTGSVCNSTTKTLRINGDSNTTAPLSGSGVLFNLNFVRVSGTEGASTPLTWRALPNDFRFFDITFTRRAPTNTPPGSITIGAAPSAANGVVRGRITSPDGMPVSGAVVRLSGTQNRKTITDVNGNYHFDSVETNGFYTVSPSRANYIFNPSARPFSQLAETTEAAFGATFTGDAVNPLDTAEYFVRQQYVDILGREPDEGGFNYWSDRVLACGTDIRCVSARRRDVAAAFFIEAEFQETGSFIYGLYKGSLGRGPVYTEFSSDRQQVVAGANLDAAKQAFAESFVSRAEFASKYQANSTGESFVEALLTTVSQASGVDLRSQRAALLNRYNTGSNLNQSRSLVLRWLMDNSDFRRAEYNSAFVLTEYFSYLRRDPDQGGYAFWVDKLSNQDNYRSMVCAFVTSREYQQRFSAVVTHTDAECGEQ